MTPICRSSKEELTPPNLSWDDSNLLHHPIVRVLTNMTMEYELPDVSPGERHSQNDLTRSHRNIHSRIARRWTARRRRHDYGVKNRCIVIITVGDVAKMRLVHVEGMNFERVVLDSPLFRYTVTLVQIYNDIRWRGRVERMNHRMRRLAIG